MKSVLLSSVVAAMIFPVTVFAAQQRPSVPSQKATVKQAICLCYAVTPSYAGGIVKKVELPRTALPERPRGKVRNAWDTWIVTIHMERFAPKVRPVLR